MLRAQCYDLEHTANCHLEPDVAQFQPPPGTTALLPPAISVLTENTLRKREKEIGLRQSDRALSSWKSIVTGDKTSHRLGENTRLSDKGLDVRGPLREKSEEGTTLFRQETGL